MNHLRYGLVAALFVLLLPAASSFAQGGPAKAEKSPDKLLAAAWWNDEATVANLGLDGEVRSQLDGMVKQALTSLRAIRADRQGTIEAFDKSLAEGDFDAAKKHADRLEAIGGQLESTGAQLKVDGLSLLTAEQREDLTTEQISGSWLRRNRRGQQSGNTERRRQGDS